MISLKEEIIRFFKENEYNEIVFLACGSSYWASLSAKMTMTDQTGIHCSAVKSGDIVLNPEYYKKLFKKPLLIIPSRSGSTSETLMAIEYMKKWYSSPVLSIIGFEKSPVLIVSDMSIEMNWISEESICQTRAFSNLYMAMVLLGGMLGNDEKLLNEFQKYFRQFDKIKRHIEAQVVELINDLPYYNNLIVVANGKQYGVAVEGAYINVEMACFPSHYYGTLELRHGPVVLIDKTYLTFIFCSTKPNRYEIQLISEIKKAGGRAAVIAGESSDSGADYSFILGMDTIQEVSALFGVFVLQALAYHKAVQLGLNPDKPKDLVQWISL